MERDREKFPKSYYASGGISYYGLSDLMVVEGTMNEFAYAQAILLYKKNIEELIKIFILSKTEQPAIQARLIKSYWI